MKKIVLIAIFLMCLFTLPACGKSKDAPDKVTETLDKNDTNHKKDTNHKEEKQTKEDASKVENENNKGETIAEKPKNSTQNNTSIVEDEVNMGEQTSGKQNDSTEKENINKPSDTQPTEDDQTSNEHRYDEDGDGFVDGWY